MANDLYTTVKYNDGEGLTHGDLNDSQRFLASRLNDQILEKLIGSPNNSDPEFGSQKGANAATQWAYCIDVGGANPKQGTANNKVKIGAGTLLQKIGNSTGSEPQLLAYTFDGTDEYTLSNGDATNPRVDMIQMKLEYEDTDSQSRDFEDATTHVVTTTSMTKKRRVKATVSVKAGTPAASPTYPTPDAGYVPIACVVVGATYTGAAALKYIDTAGAVAVLHDLRMPISIKPHTVACDFFTVESTTVPALSSTDNVNGSPVTTHTRSHYAWTLAASANPIYYPLTFLKAGDVIVGWQIILEKNTDGAATVTGNIVYASSGGDVTVAANQTNNANAPGALPFGANVYHTVVDARSYAVKITPSASVTPAADRVYNLTIFYKPFGSKIVTQAICQANKGRLIAISLTTANGSNTANTTRLCRAGGFYSDTNSYLADISTAVETSSTNTRKHFTLANLVANPLFSAGPTILGNGTHYPPIWGNGKRCYEETMSLESGSTTTLTKLAVFFENGAAFNTDVFDVTYYMAEGF